MDVVARERMEAGCRVRGCRVSFLRKSPLRLRTHRTGNFIITQPKQNSPLAALGVGVAPASAAKVLPLRGVLIIPNARRRTILRIRIYPRLDHLIDEVLDVARQAAVAAVPVGAGLGEPGGAVRPDAGIVVGSFRFRSLRPRGCWTLLQLSPVAHDMCTSISTRAISLVGRAGSKHGHEIQHT